MKTITYMFLAVCSTSLLVGGTDLNNSQTHNDTEKIHPTRELLKELEQAYKAHSKCEKALNFHLEKPSYRSRNFVDSDPSFSVEVLKDLSTNSSVVFRSVSQIQNYQGQRIFNTFFVEYYTDGEIERVEGQVLNKKPLFIEENFQKSMDDIIRNTKAISRFSEDIKVLREGYTSVAGELFRTLDLVVESRLCKHRIYYIPSKNCFWGLKYLDSKALHTGTPSMEELYEERKSLKLKNDNDGNRKQLPGPLGSCDGEGQGMKKVSRTFLDFPDLDLCTEINPVYAGIEHLHSLHQSIKSDLSIIKTLSSTRVDRYIWSDDNTWHANNDEKDYGILEEHLIGRKMDVPFAYKAANQTFFHASHINELLIEDLPIVHSANGQKSKVEIYPFSEFSASTQTFSYGNSNVKEFEIYLYHGNYQEQVRYFFPQAACPDSICHELGHTILNRSTFYSPNSGNRISYAVEEFYCDFFSVAAKHFENSGYQKVELTSTNSPLLDSYYKSLFEVSSCHDMSNQAHIYGRYLINPRSSNEIDHFNQTDLDLGGHLNSTFLSLLFSYLSFPEGLVTAHPTYANQVPKFKALGFWKTFDLINIVLLNQLSAVTVNFSQLRSATESVVIRNYGSGSSEHQSVSDAFEAVGIFHAPVEVTPFETHTIEHSLENATRLFFVYVPPGVDQVNIQIAGDNGNADLYYAYDDTIDPWLGDFDGHSQDLDSNDALQVFTNQITGPVRYLTFAVQAKDAFTDLDVKVLMQGDGVQIPLGTDLPQTASGPQQRVVYPLQIPDAIDNQQRLVGNDNDNCFKLNTRLVITTTGSQGENVDLYLKQGREASSTDYDFRATDVGPNETITVINPPPGSWYLALESQTAYDDVVLRADFYDNEIYDNMEYRLNVDSHETLFFTKPIAPGSRELRVDINDGEGSEYFYLNQHPAPEDLDDWFRARKRQRNIVYENDLHGDRWEIAVHSIRDELLINKKFFATLSPKPQDEPPQLLVSGHKRTILSNGLDIFAFNPGDMVNVQTQLPWSSRISGPQHSPPVLADIYQGQALLWRRSTNSDCRGLANLQFPLLPEMVGDLRIKIYYQYEDGLSPATWLNLMVENDPSFAVTPQSVELNVLAGEQVTLPMSFENLRNDNYLVQFECRNLTQPGLALCSVELPGNGSSASASALDQDGFNLQVDAASITPGVYAAELVVHGGPNNFEQVIPLQFSVIQPGDAEMSVLGISSLATYQKAETQETYEQLMIFNPGDTLLYVDILEQAPWLTFTSDFQTPVAPGETRTASYRIDTAGMAEGDHKQTQIVINSNGGNTSFTLELRVLTGAWVCVQPYGHSSYFDWRITWDYVTTYGQSSNRAALDVWNCGSGQLYYHLVEKAADADLDISPSLGISYGSPVTHRAGFEDSSSLEPGLYQAWFGVDMNPNGHKRFVGPEGLFSLTVSSPEGAYPMLSERASVIRTSLDQAPAPYHLDVENAGQGTLRYTWQTDQPWVSVTNASAQLTNASGKKRHALQFETAGLEAGRYPFLLTFNSDAGSKTFEMELEVTGKPALCLESNSGVQITPSSLQITREQMISGTASQVTLRNCGGEVQAYVMEPVLGGSLLQATKGLTSVQQPDWLAPGESTTLSLGDGRGQMGGVEPEVWAFIDPETQAVLGYLEIGTEAQPQRASW